MAVKREPDQLSVDTAADPEELVEYIAPRRGPEDKEIFVGVNGETLRIQRGVPVKIRRKFREVLDHAEQAVEEAYQNAEKQRRASSRPLAEL